MTQKWTENYWSGKYQQKIQVDYWSDEAIVWMVKQVMEWKEYMHIVEDL